MYPSFRPNLHFLVPSAQCTGPVHRRSTGGNGKGCSFSVLFLSLRPLFYSSYLTANSILLYSSELSLPKQPRPSHANPRGFSLFPPVTPPLVWRYLRFTTRRLHDTFSQVDCSCLDLTKGDQHTTKIKKEQNTLQFPTTFSQPRKGNRKLPHPTPFTAPPLTLLCPSP